MHADNAIIDALGGPAKLAELLKFPKECGRQRVCNWRKRGIPARVKLERPDLFLRGAKPRTKKTATQPHESAQA